MQHANVRRNLTALMRANSTAFANERGKLILANAGLADIDDGSNSGTRGFADLSDTCLVLVTYQATRLGMQAGRFRATLGLQAAPAINLSSWSLGWVFQQGEQLLGAGSGAFNAAGNGEKMRSSCGHLGPCMSQYARRLHTAC